MQHYSTARKLVRAGRTTWGDLERAGKSAPRSSRVRGLGEVSKWFMEAEQPVSVEQSDGVELLAALKKIEHEWDGEPCDMAEAREAIAKAESAASAGPADG